MPLFWCSVRAGSCAADMRFIGSLILNHDEGCTKEAARQAERIARQRLCEKHPDVEVAAAQIPDGSRVPLGFPIGQLLDYDELDRWFPGEMVRIKYDEHQRRFKGVGGRPRSNFDKRRSRDKTH